MPQFLPFHGRVAEWPNASVLKTEGLKGSVGSNPTSSVPYPGNMMLLHTLIFSLFLSFLTIPMFAIPMKQPRIAVIGGGIAGLTAAYRLQTMGFNNVSLYEAKNRVGGRIFSVYVKEKVQELGGANILDGGDSDNMLGLIRELGLETIEGKDHKMSFFLTDQGPVSLKDLVAEHHFNPAELKSQLKTLAKNSHNLKEVIVGLLKGDNLLQRVVSQRIASYEGDTPEHLSPIYIETLYYILLGGLSQAHQRQGGYLEYSFLKKGNSVLPETLAAKLEKNFHPNSPLKSVEQMANDTYSLSFENGVKVIADVIVLAVPCTVYKNIDFGKTIPKDTLSAIQKVQYGRNSKILVPLAKEPKTKDSFATDRLACFFYARDNIATVFYSADSANFTKENIAPTYQKDFNVLSEWFGNAITYNPAAYAEDVNFRSYTTPVGYNWINDPFIQGSYSYIAPGQEYLLDHSTYQGETVRTLFAPVQDSIFFAGEHTSILWDVLGTMEAACESGERTARMIFRKYHE